MTLPGTDTASTADEAGLRRRRSRFGRRAVLLLLPILGVGLTWIGAELWQLKRIRDRERLERKLAEDGGFSCDAFRLEGKDWVWATVKTDAGLEALKGLPGLQLLDLTDSHVTDAGLAHLKNLPELEWLRLDGTEVTDAGLEHIKAMPQLRLIHLYATQVTERGVADLRKALPNLEIRW